ncbi:sulfotransferase domain-containing protein [Halomicronema sp. CCY15110]|uniref:sulfotransferase domain-containing protein n=1 Tax=Halomicronema sp. CCY15110 TaxID=2767773 RepID=UPI00194F3D7F|nr:sulfotransferase domain-containing protein [Halomicronema sp. CCY15110]
MAIGEASTSYLYIPSAAERIKKYLPDVKLIVVLRQPVDRAYSHYLHHYRNGGEVNLSLTEAIRDEKKRQEEDWSPFWQYQEIGFYHKHLSHLFNVFDPKNIKVCFYEDLCGNPQDLLKDIFLFLGVDLDAEYTLPNKKYNVSTISKKPRSKVLHNLLNGESWFKSLAKSILDDSIRQRIRHFASQKNNVKIAQPYKPKLSSEEWNKLNEAYKQDILSLQELVDRDLGHWLIRKSSSPAK